MFLETLHQHDKTCKKNCHVRGGHISFSKIYSKLDFPTLDNSTFNFSIGCFFSKVDFLDEKIFVPRPEFGAAGRSPRKNMEFVLFLAGITFLLSSVVVDVRPAPSLCRSPPPLRSGTRGAPSAAPPSFRLRSEARRQHRGR